MLQIRRIIGLIFLFFLSATIHGQTVDMIIGEKDAEKAHLCWNPIVARVALTEPKNADVKVTLISSPRTDDRKNGQVVFFAKKNTGKDSTSKNFTSSKSIEIVLPKNGDWVEFLVAGDFGYPSTNPNDVRIAVVNGDGIEIGIFNTSVRVRKNAEKLTSTEWQRFINTLAILHDVNNDSSNSLYVKYPVVHNAAWNMAHGGPAFLPWHRAFLLALERELQVIDSFVTIPYWKFDTASKNIFTLMAMGTPAGESLDGKVEFSANHPWKNWRVGGTKLVDSRPGNGSQPVGVIPEDLIIGSNGDYSTLWSNMEGSHHGDAHDRLNGWLARGISPSDPVFFLIHAQVDRVWAKWQFNNSLFDPTSSKGYAPLGTWESSGKSRNRPKGHWSNDTMWPWDGDESNETQRFSLRDLNWLGHLEEDRIEFPIISNFAPNLSPLVADMIDYMSFHGKNKSLGYCYDDVPFRRGKNND
ncbi:tyrosinase [Nitrosospira sp. Nsp5]|uniref:Tyrosinase n=2 Tax=Nitrosomonadaceae TaxID=206379 RepID=A0ABY0TIF9_9PROT|nr:tyrosinase [Nitrosospira sp. Nsp5]SDQ88843.1 tyrosinase [Nitrosospira multiformis]